MSVYNGAKYLRESLDSILAQTFRDFEFIIINDASQDSTAEILADYSARDSRIRIITNQQNLGLAASLNIGLADARGKYIARHDADDISFPDRLAVQYRYLEANPEYDLIGGGMIRIDGKGREKNIAYALTDEKKLRHILPNHNVMSHPTFMFRCVAGLRYREKFLNSQDYDLLLRMMTDGGRFTNVPNVVVRYRIQEGPHAPERAARRSLFSAKAREFYRQRLAHGNDEYDTFDLESLWNFDAATTDDPTALRNLTLRMFRDNKMADTRQLIRRLWKTGRLVEMYSLLYPLSFIPAPILDAARRVKRAAPSNIHVLRHHAAANPHLALLFTTGNGIDTWRHVGSLKRELELYIKLIQKGWRVTFFTYDRTVSPLDPVPSLKVITQSPYLLPKHFRGIYEAGIPLLRWQEGRTVDVVMTNQAHGGWAAVPAARLWGAKVVARCGMVFGETAETLNFTGKKVERKIGREKWTFRHADRCIIPTAELAEWASQNYSLQQSDIAVIPNYVNTELFRPYPDVECDIDILSVGRLTTVKRYHLIIEAAARLGASVTIIGDGPEEAALRKFAATKGAKLTIIKRVSNEQLPRYFARSRVFSIVSTREGHPKALVEAMACGCACVGADASGIRNQITHGDNGLLSQPFPDKIGEQVGVLLNDAGYRDALGKSARRYALANFALDNIATSYDDILRELL